VVKAVLVVKAVPVAKAGPVVKAVPAVKDADPRGKAKHARNDPSLNGLPVTSFLRSSFCLHDHASIFPWMLRTVYL
jgi:hypothetical protein